MLPIDACQEKMPTMLSIIVFIVLFSSMAPTMSQGVAPDLSPPMSHAVAIDFSPLVKIYVNGTIERLIGKSSVPPSLDPKTGVQSKDVAISRRRGISARLYLPNSVTNSTTNSTQSKLPLLVYFHGGGFCVEHASSPTYHNYLNSLVTAANVVAVSVDYRLAPEHPLPIAYQDSWAALNWVSSHFGGGNRSEEWLSRYADPQRVFFSGDSAGANIAHQMAMKLGSDRLNGFKLNGIVLVHPFFWGSQPVGAEATLPVVVSLYMTALWRFVNPTSFGPDDPLFNPTMDPKLRELGCGKVLVFVAGKDALKDRGLYYGDVLKKSGWKGVVEVSETKGESHVFHLFSPPNKNSEAMLEKIVSFLHQS
ncbi:PREDICTED: probable carboxylesterase [Prunus dulcis]|uniref:PREDICTED: probable carboxylesterase n=3 Tax=Prunus dulcis TaxID=3755 RepID=A0A5E4FFP5_PRUDU|nr:PREDICTED: probable carboxylesterase [Prunus dulcis]